MRKISWFSLTLMLVLSLVSVSSATASSVDFNPRLYDPSVGSNVSISFGDNGSSDGAHHQSASSSPLVDSGGKAFGSLTPVYCTDLWHDSSLGDKYKISPSSNGLSSSDIGDAPILDKQLSTTDAANRIGWMLSFAPAAGDTSTAAVDARSAIQLGIWYVLDAYKTNFGFGSLQSGFSYAGGDAGMAADYAVLTGFAGYNSGTSYGANFFSATSDSGQDVVTGSSSGPQNHFSSVPEPSTFLGVSVMCLGFFALRKRFQR